MKILKAINEGLSFLLELAMLAAFAYWGFQSTTSIGLKWGLGISLPLAMAILWGFFFAPRANHRLTIVPGVVLSLGLFWLAAGALYQAHQTGLAIALALLAVIFDYSSSSGSSGDLREPKTAPGSLLLFRRVGQIPTTDFYVGLQVHQAYADSPG